jgi:hypothetical protein
MVGIVPLWRTFFRCFLPVDVDKQGHKNGTLIVGIKIRSEKYFRLQGIIERVTFVFDQTTDLFSKVSMRYPNLVNHSVWAETQKNILTNEKKTGGVTYGTQRLLQQCQH